MDKELQKENEELKRRIKDLEDKSDNVFKEVFNDESVKFRFTLTHPSQKDYVDLEKFYDIEKDQTSKQ